MNAELELRNRQLMGKLVVIAVGMLGFGFAMVPMYRQICDAIGITDSSIYVTGVGPSLTGSALLNAITTQTGGRLFSVKNPKELPEIAYKIGGCLRNQYMLGYMPNHSEKDGTYRKIRLQISRPKGYPRLHAVWRQGYYAPRE